MPNNSISYGRKGPALRDEPSGCDNDQRCRSEIALKQNLAIASNFKPMTTEERRALEDRCELWAADGRFERFKTTTMYDGAVGREQHQYPEAQKLPA